MSQRSHQHPEEVQRGTKAEGRDRVKSQPLKAGQVVDLGADLLGQRALFKTEFPHFGAGRTDQTKLHLKSNTAVSW
jgi:hypothetical protein